MACAGQKCLCVATPTRAAVKRSVANQEELRFCITGGAMRMRKLKRAFVRDGQHTLETHAIAGDGG